MKFVDDRIEEYCREKSYFHSKTCQRIFEYTYANVHSPQMVIGEMEANFLGMLLRNIKAKKVLELGTFTGYSALAMAEQLPSGGSVHTIDINEETTGIARSFWQESSHGYKIIGHLGSGLEIMDGFKKDQEKFCLVFIDADKGNYTNYLKKAVDLLRDGGLIVLDNCLWSGEVLKSENEKPARATKDIQFVNDYIRDQQDLVGTLFPIRDGLFVVSKK